MDPYSEERLRDEVIYLHALWHIGPPAQTQRPNFPRPVPMIHHPPYIPSSLSVNPPRPNLQIHTPSSSSQPLMENKKRARNKKKRKTIEKSDKEWPCEKPISELPSTSGSAWPEFKSVSSEKAPLTDEEKAKLSAAQVQHNGLEAVKAFFKNENNDEIEDELVDEDEEDDDESDEFEFFLNLFRADAELKDYYVKSCESGELCCLVCGGIGQKVTKRFKNCVALVQHSVSISKTARRRAHRAYGQVVCKVLGWDIKNLPKNGSSSVASHQADQKQDIPGACQVDQGKTLPEATVHNSNSVGEEVFGSEGTVRDVNDNVPADDFNDSKESPCAADIPSLTHRTVENEESDVGGAAADSKDEGNIILTRNGLTEDGVNQSVQPIDTDFADIEEL